MEKSPTTTKPVRVVIPAELEKFGELARKTCKPKPKQEDVQSLRRYLEAHPQLWSLLGDVSNLAYEKLIDATAGNHVAFRESLMVGRQAMRKELGCDRASALERLLIDHVVLCWLRLHNVEFNHTAAFEKSIPLRVGEYWERRLSAAQRRYLRACETLGRVRRLRLPSLQVNIGEKQVNVTNAQ